MIVQPVLSLFLIFGCAQSQDPDKPNYFVDAYESGTYYHYYAYPPGFCIESNGYFMYQCVESTNDTFYMSKTV